MQSDIRRWVADGLIDAATGERLSSDVSRNPGRAISFGGVLGVMAAILLAAALLLFISANWQDMPRQARVGGLFALIFAAYIGGAMLIQRGRPMFGEAFYLVGAAAFGGSIALIGQMYHLSGDETQAVLIWCLGTLLAAVGLRSAILTNAAVVLAVAWMAMRAMDWDGKVGFPDAFLLLGAVIWAASYWTQSVATRHLLLLSLILYAIILCFNGRLVMIGGVVAAVSAAVFLAAHFAPATVERFARLGGPYPVYPFVGFLVGMGMLQIEAVDGYGSMVMLTLIVFAAIVAALLLRGRQSQLMRWIAYAAFTVELVFLYTVLLGSMIDTAALFLLTGAALAAAAVVIMRLERRFSAKGEA
ncbi:DUF2157 domain-containing protein [Salmonella enterica subsp. enterica]|nr:DUF2157 domain-containing protein [Salmonella enterica subsp. enterica]